MRTSAPARGRGETAIVKLCGGRGLSLARSRDLGDTGHCTAGHGDTAADMLHRRNHRNLQLLCSIRVFVNAVSVFAPLYQSYNL